MPKRKIFKGQFDAVRNDLLTTAHPQAVIAQRHRVSSSHVSEINLARTWGNFLNGTKAKTPLRKRVQPLKPTKVEQAKAAGLHPHTHLDRLAANPVTSGVDPIAQADRLREKIKAAYDAPITMGEFSTYKQAASRRIANVKTHSRNNTIAIFVLVGAVLVLALFK